MGTLESIEIHHEGLAHLLADKSLYVPTYQRAFAWRKQHVSALLLDLAGALQAERDGDSAGGYFLGSIVTIKAKKSENTLEVVDGQQRLATTSIFLTAIRDYFIRQHDDEQAGHIQRTYLRPYDPWARDPSPRLKLSADDNEFYADSIIAMPQDRKRGPKASQESHKRLARAYKEARDYFDKLASGYDKANAVSALLRWESFLHNRAQVIHVTVEDDADAYVIFETLNDRGLELSTADLLKNYLFGRSGDRFEEAKEHWAKMTGALQTVTHKNLTVEYIRQLWSSTRGIARRRDLFYHIKQKITSKKAAIELSTELDENAKLYAAILNPNHEIWAKFGTHARQAIVTLRVLRMERIRPLLLAIMGVFSDAEIKKSMRYIVSAAVRLIIGHGSPGPVEKAILGASAKIRSGDIRSTGELAQNLASIVPGDSVFERYFAAARVKNPQQARYYLRALEEALVSKGPMVFVVSENEENANLEHILPEKGRDQGWRHIPPEKADELCRRLGNLLLLDPKVNARLTSSRFADKVKVYAGAENTRLTKQLATKYASSEWGEEQINEWQAILAKLAVKAWSLNV
jgi:hypothetical protein